MASLGYALKVPHGVSISLSTQSPQSVIFAGSLDVMRELSRALTEAGTLIEMDVSEKEVASSG